MGFSRNSSFKLMLMCWQYVSNSFLLSTIGWAHKGK